MEFQETTTKPQVYQDIKRIIEDVLNQQKQESLTSQSLIYDFLTRRHLLTVTRLQKANRNLSVFKELNTFVNASEIFHKIKREICKYVTSTPSQKEITSQFKFKSIGDVKIGQDQNQIRLRQFDEMIQEAYGKKIRRRNNEHATEIQNILKNTIKNDPEKFQREAERLFKVLNEEQAQTQIKNMRRTKMSKLNMPIRKLELTSREKHKIQEYCFIALTLLSLILNRKKNQYKNPQSQGRKSTPLRSLHEERNSNKITSRKSVIKINHSSDTVKNRQGKSLKASERQGKKYNSVHTARIESGEEIVREKENKEKNQKNKKRIRFMIPKTKSSNIKPILKKNGVNKYITHSMNNLLEQINFETAYYGHNKGQFEDYLKETQDASKMAEDESLLLMKQIKHNIAQRSKGSSHSIPMRSKHRI